MGRQFSQSLVGHLAPCGAQLQRAQRGGGAVRIGAVWAAGSGPGPEADSRLMLTPHVQLGPGGRFSGLMWLPHTDKIHAHHLRHHDRGRAIFG